MLFYAIAIGLLIFTEQFLAFFELVANATITVVKAIAESISFEFGKLIDLPLIEFS